MRWLRLVAVLAWMFEMVFTWQYLSAGTHSEGIDGCYPPIQRHHELWLECGYWAQHRWTDALLVIVVCTATTIAVLLLTSLPFRVKRRSVPPALDPAERVL